MCGRAPAPWDFSSTHSTTARSERIEVEPDDVTHLVDKQRIVGQLESLAAVRLQRERFPDPLHRRRGPAPMRVPCHASSSAFLPTGSVSSVVVTTSATFWSVMVPRPPRGVARPGDPSKRFSAKRRRQVVTVTRVMPSRSAIARLLTPSAASYTISAAWHQRGPPCVAVAETRAQLPLFPTTRSQSPSVLPRAASCAARNSANHSHTRVSSYFSARTIGFRKLDLIYEQWRSDTKWLNVWSTPGYKGECRIVRVRVCIIVSNLGFLTTGQTAVHQPAAAHSPSA